MVRKILIILTLIGISSAYAEEWSAKIGPNPKNAPTKNTSKISPKLDFLAFMLGDGRDSKLVVRVRNGKHKQGPSNISIQLENSSIIVQRIDIVKAMPIIKTQKDGEHLMDTFMSEDKSYNIFYKVSRGKLDPAIIVRSE